MKVTADQALADIADQMNVPVAEVDHELDLRDQGMDSVRVMELVEKWRSDGVTKVDFIQLAEDQRVTHWLGVLRELQES